MKNHTPKPSEELVELRQALELFNARIVDLIGWKALVRKISDQYSQIIP